MERGAENWSMLAITKKYFVLGFLSKTLKCTLFYQLSKLSFLSV